MQMLIIVSSWILSGIVSAGISNAYFQRKYPSVREDSDLTRSLAIGFTLGPIWLIVGIILGNFLEYGWSLKINAVEGYKTQTHP